jgi:hypothetical protein
MKEIPISAVELLKLNDIDLSAKPHQLRSSGFCHYTSIYSLNKILESGYMYAGNLGEMNDQNEHDRLGEKAKTTNVLCFCQSNSEKIPFWYLYAGIRGDGSRIRITPANMVKFISGIEYINPIVDGVRQENEILRIKKDFEIEYGWVYYLKQGETNVKFHQKWYSVGDERDCFTSENYFVKDYPWEYEKEFRIVFRMVCGKQYSKIAVSIAAISAVAEITIGPECDNSVNCLEMNGFRKYFTSKLKRSTLNVKMNLLERNRDAVLSSFRDILNGIDKEKLEEIRMIVDDELKKNS